MVSAFFQRNNVVDDLSDFQSPQKKIQFKDPPVMPKTKAARKRKLPAKKSKTKTESDTDIFEKVLFHHSNADGLNSDDLQMALALSRSLADTHGTNCEGPNSSITEAIRSAEPNDKEDVIRQTFKQFGFKKSDNNGESKLILIDSRWFNALTRFTCRIRLQGLLRKCYEKEMVEIHSIDTT